MRSFNARIEFRTSLEQAARVAALAGELEQNESWVVRELLARGLDDGAHDFLAERIRDAEREMNQRLADAETRPHAPIA